MKYQNPARVFLLGALLVVCRGVLAQGDDKVPPPVPFYKVYQYDVPYQGWAEPTLWTTYIPSSDVSQDYFGKKVDRDGLFAHSAEFEYGVTDHFSLAGYADFEAPDSAATRFVQGRVEARYRFGQRYDDFFNTAVYAEYVFPDHAFSDEDELETRLILTKDIGDFRVALNPIASFATSGEDAGAVSLGFDAGVYYRRYYAVQPGLELYSRFGKTTNIQNFGDQQQTLFATVDIRPARGLDWQLGVGAGLNGSSDDIVVKSIISYDFDFARLLGLR